MKAVVSHFDFVEDSLDFVGKKGLLKLVFKFIRLKNGRVKDFELYEPFKSLYEGVKIRCQLKETKRVMTIPESVYTSALSDAHWPVYRRTMECLAEALVGEELE